MSLSAQAQAARIAYFLGQNPSERRLALFKRWENSVPEADRPIRAEALGDDLEINVLDVIGYDPWTGGGITAKAFKRTIDQYPDAKQIRVLINSPGGIIDDGMAIFNALRRHQALVVTECLGIAASIASVIFFAGDRREMNVGTQLMVHRAWGFTIGNAEDHEAQVRALKSYDELRHAREKRDPERRGHARADERGRPPSPRC